VAFLLERDHGVSLPRRLQIALSKYVQKIADETGKEISASELWNVFENNFLIPMDGFEYKSHSSKTENSVNEIDLNIKILNEDINIKGRERS
ncbi:MAG: 2-isopropylmalate synthase, partial [Opitutae bacterium]|nr:2-isopropylmalate synthase [Opitutae bacterium]